MPGAILGFQNTEMNKTNKNLHLHWAPILMRRKATDKKRWWLSTKNPFSTYPLENGMLSYISQFPLELGVVMRLSSRWWNVSGSDLRYFLNWALRLWLCLLRVLFPFSASRDLNLVVTQLQSCIREKCCRRWQSNPVGGSQISEWLEQRYSTGVDCSFLYSSSHGTLGFLAYSHLTMP